MKKFGMMAISLMLAAALASSQTIAIKFGSGWGTSSAGDFASGLLGLNNYLASTYTGLSGEFLAPHSSLNLNAEVIYYFRPSMGIGLGLGYFGLSKTSSVSYNINLIQARERLTPTFKIIPITLSFHDLVPLSSKLNLDLTAGFGAYLAKLDWSYQMDLVMTLPEDPSQVFRGTDALLFNSNYRLGFGLHAGAGLEYVLSPRVAVFLGFTGRLASVSGFNGGWAERGSGDFWDFSDNGTGAYVWSFDWTLNNTAYSQLAIQNEAPSGTTISNTRHAKLGLSGISVGIGIKIGLGR